MRHSLILTATLVVACSRASSPEPADPRPPHGCRKAATPPELVAPPALGAVSSHVTVRASVTEQRLRREIARELPETLDSGQRNMSGVRVSYVVKRGDLGFELEGDRLVLTTPIQASASVCKTFGPLCPVLGRCAPELNVRAGVPIVLQSDYSHAGSQVSVNLVRGCTIAGFNASGEIQSRATSEARNAQAQIDRQLPPIREHAVTGWQELHRTIELDDGACLRVVPHGVRQERPQLKSGMLTAAASVAGELTLESPCRDLEPPPVGELPPLEVTDEVPEGVRLQAPLRLTWAAVGVQLTDSIEGHVALQRLAVQAAMVDEQARLVLELETEDEPCGPVWLSAEPWFDATRNVIRLRAIAVVPGSKPRHKLDDLPAQLQRHAAIELPVQLDDLAQRIDRTRADLMPEIAEADVEIHLGRPTVDRVALDAQALVPVVSVTGTAHVRAE